jgi:acyl carrier protein phosphodiesterase
MNFLAHLYLSGDHSDLMVGNFIADHVKGNQIELFSNRVKNGIILHRGIDAFTDGHETVRKSVIRLRPGFRKYAGVVVDMFYDHFLAANWHDYSEVSLEVFTAQCYSILQNYIGPLPERTKRMLYFMVRDNWLLAYARKDGIQAALNGMASRTSFYSGMENAVEALLEDYNDYLSEFREFFPDLVTHSNLLRNEILNKTADSNNETTGSKN